MSQIQGASSSAYQIQWPNLQATQQNGSQASASDPMSFGLDPFSGASGQTSGSSASGGTSGPPFSLDAMSALISAQEQSGTSGMSPMQQKVFGELDADNDGSVSSTELQNAFGSDNTDAANYVMSKLDTNGDGSISPSEFTAGTTKGAGHHHHHMHAGPPPDASQGAQGDQSTQGTQDPLSALLSSSTDGASSQSTSNSDGSTTTTITYADGSKVSMTSAAAAASSDTSGSDTSGSGSSLSQTQQNLLEQLIKLQAQLVQNLSGSASATTALATI
jgi:hypothetical protein